MKKILLTTLALKAIYASLLFAGDENVATLTDIKETTVFLTRGQKTIADDTKKIWITLEDVLRKNKSYDVTQRNVEYIMRKLSKLNIDIEKTQQPFNDDAYPFIADWVMSNK